MVEIPTHTHLLPNSLSITISASSQLSKTIISPPTKMSEFGKIRWASLEGVEVEFLFHPFQHQRNNKNFMRNNHLCCATDFNQIN